MPTIKKRIIIGIILLVGLTVQVGNANALYSPRISRRVSAMRQHILDSQAINGDGSLLEAIESIKIYNKTRRDAGEASGISANARAAQKRILKNASQEILQNPFDSLNMVFNLNAFNPDAPVFISNCLRDEIWQLESLRDVLGAEMVKAYLMDDTINGRILEDDYVYIIAQLRLLRQYGSSPGSDITISNAEGELETISSNMYFFEVEAGGEDSFNYYDKKYFDSDATGCPDGEFEQVFEQVVNSWKTLKVLGSGGGTEWGNIKEMAQAQARIRARQWIKANQLTLSLGGENGAGLQSLVKGNGWDKFLGNLETQTRIVENMIGPITPLFDTSNYQSSVKKINAACAYYYVEDKVFRDCNERQFEQYKLCKKDKEAAEAAGNYCTRFRTINETKSISGILNQQAVEKSKDKKIKKEARRAIIYSMTLDSVAEQAIYEIDAKLNALNQNIRAGYEGIDAKAGAGIPSIIAQLGALENQCINKK